MNLKNINDIAENDEGIAANVADILNNSLTVSAAIKANADNIASNEVFIAANIADIATNSVYCYMFYFIWWLGFIWGHIWKNIKMIWKHITFPPLFSTLRLNFHCHTKCNLCLEHTFCV